MNSVASNKTLRIQKHVSDAAESCVLLLCLRRLLDWCETATDGRLIKTAF